MEDSTEKVAQNMGKIYNLLREKTYPVDLVDLYAFGAAHYGYKKDTIKMWLALEKSTGKKDTTYIGATCFVLDKKA